MSAVYDDKSLRWVYDNYAKGKVKEMVNQYRLYFGRCDDVGSMVELHRLARQKFATEKDFEETQTIGRKTIDDAFRTLGTAVIIQAMDDYYDARRKNDIDAVERIERWITDGNFYLFCWKDYDTDFILKRFRTYDGERISMARNARKETNSG